jgi:Na+/melibiose symporter-like transporter
MAVGSGPVMLSLAGWFPAYATDALFHSMVVLGVIQVMLIVMTGVVTASMIADIVESRAVATGRREEGLLFSVLSFIGKVASGVGVWAGGIMLALIEFPTDTLTTDVSAEVITRLGWLYGPTLALFYALSIVALMFFRLDRETHLQNLALLRNTPDPLTPNEA